MLSNEVFKKEMDKLMQSCNYEIPQSGLVMWFNDLKDEGFNDEDFKKGITDTRRGCGRYFPTLGQLIDNCRPYYTARMEKEGYIQRGKDEETTKRLFNSDLADTPGRRLFLAAKAGNFNKKELAEEMRELDKQCPGKGWAEQAAELESSITQG
jgi:hypothetical protein